MGQSLSEPETAKESAYCQNEQYKVGSSCMQGWRLHMEDSHTHILSLPNDPGTAFFAVYDGHGGSVVSQFAGNFLHVYITNRPEYAEGKIGEAMKMAFLDIDDYIRENMYDYCVHMVGSTAVTTIIKDNRLYCANAGDSRAIACVNGKVELLSLDHKPNNEIELKRISEAGGWVEFNRVNGNLALSRALGDFAFKKNSLKSPEEQIVTAYPDIEERDIGDDWDFLVLACDGIWDCLSNEEVLDFCAKRIGMGMMPEDICEELMTHCLAPDCQMGGIGGDNMTVVLVCFLHNRPYEDLVAKCASFSKNTSSASSDHSTDSSPSKSNDEKLEEEPLGDEKGDGGDAPPPPEDTETH